MLVRATKFLSRLGTSRSFSSWNFAGDSSGSVCGLHVFKCPDRTGIIAKITECIASRGGNIHDVDVFVPEHKPIFFSRSEFTFDPLLWPRRVMDNDFQKLAREFNAERSILRVPDLDAKYRIAILASKQDHCLVDLLYGWQEGKLPVDIICVISNHQRAPNTHVMRFLERHELPYHYLPTHRENKREAEILELVRSTDFLVLARYMQVLVRSTDFLGLFVKMFRMISMSYLPIFDIFRSFTLSATKE